MTFLIGFLSLTLLVTLNPKNNTYNDHITIEKNNIILIFCRKSENGKLSLCGFWWQRIEMHPLYLVEKHGILNENECLYSDAKVECSGKQHSRNTAFGTSWFEIFIFVFFRRRSQWIMIKHGPTCFFFFSSLWWAKILLSL